MTLELWVIVGTVATAIAAVITIFKAPVGAAKWFWDKWQGWKKNKLSNEEENVIREFESQDAPLEWSDGMERGKLKICEGLVKKGYLSEWSSSPSRVVVIFGLSDNGKDAFKRLVLKSHPKLIMDIHAGKRIFPEKIASKLGIPNSEIIKVIRIMEESGTLKPTKSDNKSVLFWTHK